MKKYINHANSTSNLHILYIKLAQNARSLVLENFITAMYSLFGRKNNII